MYKKIGKKQFFLLFFFFLMCSITVSAEVPIIKLGVPNVSRINANSSNYWDNYDNFDDEWDRNILANRSKNVDFYENVMLFDDSPRFKFYEDDGAEDGKYWDFLIQGGILRGRILDDALAVASEWLRIERTGTGADTAVSLVTFPSNVLIEKGLFVDEYVNTSQYLDTSLLGSWLFDNNRAYDSSIYRNHGTFYNDANAEKDILEVDGLGDYVKINDIVSLTTNHTKMMWFKGSNFLVTGNEYLMDMGANNHWMSINTGKLGAGITTTGTCYTAVAIANFTLQHDVWYHGVVVTSSEEGLQVYVNGELYGHKGACGSQEPTGIVIGGYNQANPLLLFNGSIDNVRLYNRLLSPEEIRKIYAEQNKNYGYFNELEVTGNITSENVFVPQYIYSHTNRTQVVVAVNTWTNVTFDQEVADINFGIMHYAINSSNETFSIMEDGVYEADYDFDIEDDSGSPTLIDVAGRLIYVNGSEVIGSVFETDISKQGTEAELSHDFLFRCLAGDQFKFQFVGSDAQIQISTHGVFGDHPESATVVIKKVANL